MKKMYIVSNRCKKTFTVIFALIFFSAAAIIIHEIYAVNSLPINVHINDTELALGNAECKAIPKIDNCQPHSYNGTNYLYKKYNDVTEIEEPLHLCSTHIKAVEDGIEMVIWNNEYLRLSYNLNNKLLNGSDSDDGTVKVFSFEYINNMDSIENQLTFNDTDYSYRVSSVPNEEDLSKIKEVYCEEKYIVDNYNTNENIICVECITTIQNGNDSLNRSVTSSYDVMFIKNEILYVISGSDLNTLKTLAGITLANS